MEKLRKSRIRIIDKLSLNHRLRQGKDLKISIKPLKMELSYSQEELWIKIPQVKRKLLLTLNLSNPSISPFIAVSLNSILMISRKNFFSMNLLLVSLLLMVMEHSMPLFKEMLEKSSLNSPSNSQRNIIREVSLQFDLLV